MPWQQKPTDEETIANYECSTLKYFKKGHFTVKQRPGCSLIPIVLYLPPSLDRLGGIAHNENVAKFHVLALKFDTGRSASGPPCT
ncbi:hypothetical protein HYFRA_00006396 [Hymenoscyphus fraxineus]|uniref:Uncharacterized protein n=1 Tax=Hymenoscyphus fraxineus TaxID=746836 RepID=A0A9N9KNG7_9HELO|nr:hypothetical protein HYFRA_00006396 [Hymenoscyphus fraxineus]